MYVCVCVFFVLTKILDVCTLSDNFSYLDSYDGHKIN